MPQNSLTWARRTFFIAKPHFLQWRAHRASYEKFPLSLNFFLKSAEHPTVCFFGWNKAFFSPFSNGTLLTMENFPWQLIDYGKFSLVSHLPLKKILLHIKDCSSCCGHAQGWPWKRSLARKYLLCEQSKLNSNWVWNLKNPEKSNYHNLESRYII